MLSTKAFLPSDLVIAPLLIAAIAQKGGKEEGVCFGVGAGLDYDEFRPGFEYGGQFAVSLTANNLTEEFAITEAEEGNAAVGSFTCGRPVSGRSMSVGLRYSF